MAVDTPHSEYEEFAPVWKASRDAAAGQRAVHKAGKIYLPALSEQTKENTRHIKTGRCFTRQRAGLSRA